MDGVARDEPKKIFDDDATYRRKQIKPKFGGVSDRTLDRLDPALHAAFPTANAFLEGIAAAVPGLGLVIAIMLAVLEGPGLALVEAWLDARRAEIETKERGA